MSEAQTLEDRCQWPHVGHGGEEDLLRASLMRREREVGRVSDGLGESGRGGETSCVGAGIFPSSFAASVEGESEEGANERRRER